MKKKLMMLTVAFAAMSNLIHAQTMESRFTFNQNTGLFLYDNPTSGKVHPVNIRFVKKHLDPKHIAMLKDQLRLTGVEFDTAVKALAEQNKVQNNLPKDTDHFFNMQKNNQKLLSMRPQSALVLTKPQPSALVLTNIPSTLKQYSEVNFRSPVKFGPPYDMTKITKDTFYNPKHFTYYAKLKAAAAGLKTNGDVICATPKGKVVDLAFIKNRIFQSKNRKHFERLALSSFENEGGAVRSGSQVSKFVAPSMLFKAAKLFSDNKIAIAGTAISSAGIAGVAYYNRLKDQAVKAAEAAQAAEAARIVDLSKFDRVKAALSNVGSSVKTSVQAHPYVSTGTGLATVAGLSYLAYTKFGKATKVVTPIEKKSTGVNQPAVRNASELRK